MGYVTRLENPIMLDGCVQGTSLGMYCSACKNHDANVRKSSKISLVINYGKELLMDK